ADPTWTVTNTLDDGSVGSLRWAVGQANMTGGDETIDFDPTVFATPQTIILSMGQLELTDTTGTEAIIGPAAGVAVNGGGGEPGVPGRWRCHLVVLGTDAHRRRQRLPGRRPGQLLRLDHADQLHH